MQINLSEETIITVYQSLGYELTSLNCCKRLYNTKESLKGIETRIEEVEDALAVFEELVEAIS